MNIITYGQVIANSAATLLDRIELAGSTSIVASNFTNISLVSRDLDTESVISTGSLSAVAVIQTLAVADGWTADNVGRNSRIALDGSQWPTAGHNYELSVTYTPASGAAFTKIYQVQAIG